MDAGPALGMMRAAHPQRFADFLDPRFFRRDEGKAVAPDHGTRLADEPVADRHPWPDPHALQDQRVRPDPRRLGDGDMAGDACARPDHAACADRHEGSDPRAVADLRGRVHVAQRMDARRKIRPRIQHLRQARKRDARAADPESGGKPKGAPVGSRPENGGARRPLRQPIGIFGVHRKGQRLRPGRCRLRGRKDHQIKVTFGPRPKGGCYLADRVAHDRLRRFRACAARPA